MAVNGSFKCVIMVASKNVNNATATNRQSISAQAKDGWQAATSQNPVNFDDRMWIDHHTRLGGYIKEMAAVLYVAD